jgi:hypothetical protein
LICGHTAEYADEIVDVKIKSKVGVKFKFIELFGSIIFSDFLLHNSNLPETIETDTRIEFRDYSPDDFISDSFLLNILKSDISFNLR